jgi:8-oxo-dGTP diphosphatase
MDAADRTERPAGYDPAAFPPFAVTVDVVVLTVIDTHLHVALIRRGEDPYRGRWALPGGFKRPGETLDAAAERELSEEADLRAVRLAQFGAYGDPGRDPRMDVVTVGYTAVVPEPFPLRAGTDAADARWVPVADVIDGHLQLAFDHATLVTDARTRLADDLDRTDAVLGLVGTEFTVPQLRRAYEAVWRLDLAPGEARETFGLDRRNFRRQLESPPGPFTEPTGRTTADVAASSPLAADTSDLSASDLSASGTSSEESSSLPPGRPASIHRATSAWQGTSPVRRPRMLR